MRACVNNDDFTVIVSGGGRCCWMSMCGHHIQNDWVEQRICLKFCIKLEHSAAETIWMIQKATAMGKWWLADSSWRYAPSCITSHAELFGETSNHPGDSEPLQPRFGTLWLLAFPKTQITLEREEISDFWWDSGKYYGAADNDWENCVRSQGAYFEGDWSVTVLCTMFLVSCIFFNKGVYFSYYVAGYFLDRPRIFEDSASWLQSFDLNNQGMPSAGRAAGRASLDKSLWGFLSFGGLCWGLNPKSSSLI